MNESEKKTVSRMIAIYCRAHHETGGLLCPDCSQLREYALARLENCSFGNDKPTCESCPIHCYKKTMRQKIQEVMRFSGPRMLLHHPIDAIRHLVSSRKGKRLPGPVKKTIT